MTRALVYAMLSLALVASPAAAARGGGHGGGFHGGGFHGGGFHGGGFHGGGPRGGFHGGFHHGSHDHFFFGGGVFIDPFFDPFWYPYWAYPYYPGYPVYYPPPPEEGPAGEESQTAEAPDDREAEARIGSYGLVQLRGVPDGAAVDLDGRFWLTADGLDDHWLALPEGSHTVAVRVQGAQPIERRLDVRAGANTVVRFPATRRD